MKRPQQGTLLYLGVIVASMLLTLSAFSQEHSIRFFGHGVKAPDNDRIKIALTPGSSVNIARDFTIECWIKCVPTLNNGTVSASKDGDGWIKGNIFIDRDVFGYYDLGGDYGFSIGNSEGLPSNQRVVAFGINRMGTGITIRGNNNVADNKWHHIAVTRNAETGEVKLFVDGKPDAAGNGPTGDIGYNNSRHTAYPNSDPFIVLGAEKHDAGTAYPSYNGQMDELRFSTIIRYTEGFTPPATAFRIDESTAGLYHFNEGSGSTLGDASANLSNGIINNGGTPAGPSWLNDSPFDEATVAWLQATAKKDNQKTRINWSIESGAGAAVFEIERSDDGVHFQSLAHISKRDNCTTGCDYNFTDNHPMNGRNVYRIRHTDAAGKHSYSSLLTVQFTQLNSPYKIFQTGSNLVIQNNSSIESLVIWNSGGKRLAEKKNIDEGTTYIPLSNSKGFAFIHINLTDGSKYTEKVILK
ncbi:MAG TPA: LamG domain-containing protein [Chitinophagaceae bacterium]|nr:LamG domain-containing protein [Chitinophagaceae bacterium]